MQQHYGCFAIAFDGETYNHLEFRAKISINSTVWAGHFETETLAPSINQWRLKAALEQIDGILAFASELKALPFLAHQPVTLMTWPCLTSLPPLHSSTPRQMETCKKTRTNEHISWPMKTVTNARHCQYQDEEKETFQTVPYHFSGTRDEAKKSSSQAYYGFN